MRGLRLSTQTSGSSSCRVYERYMNDGGRENVVNRRLRALRCLVSGGKVFTESNRLFVSNFT